MAIAYNYTIDRILTAPSLDELVDVVTEVDYLYKGVEDGITVHVRGTVVLETPESEGFIPYSDLTEANVISFIESKIDLVRNQNIIEGLIELKKSPKNVNKPLPWL